MNEQEVMSLARQDATSDVIYEFILKWRNQSFYIYTKENEMKCDIYLFSIYFCLLAAVFYDHW